MRLSIVVPCYNEAGNVAELHRRVVAACEPAIPQFELIYVDDGSTDGTFEAVARLRDEDPRVKAVRLSRNFGHQAALTAGLDYASGDAVLVMDADLQHPPELIPAFVAKWREGYEIVYGYRRGRRPRWGYRIVNALMHISIPPEAADFRLMDRRVVDAFRQMTERSRFIRGMVSWLGFRQTGIPYEDQERFAGQRAYTVRQTLRLALNAILSFSNIPLRVATGLGLLTLLIGLGYAGYILYVKLTDPDRVLAGWTATMMVILLVSGVQLLCLGIIAEYIGRIYEETKRRPLYVVSRTVGFQQADESVRPDSPGSSEGHDSASSAGSD